MTDLDSLQNWTALLAEALEYLPSRFLPGELAYLAATSKVENPIRDAVAFYLHERLRDLPGCMVAREYRRRDLAVLVDGLPVMELEAKALYGLNVLSAASNAEYLTRWHGNDAKSLQQTPTTSSCFLLSVVTHPMCQIGPGLWPVIKYARHYNAALKAAGGSPEAMLRQADRWETDLKQHGPVACTVRLDLGAVWGIGFRLGCYLVGPLAHGADRLSRADHPGV